MQIQRVAGKRVSFKSRESTRLVSHRTVACASIKSDISRRDIIGGFIATPLVLTGVANAEEGGQKFKMRTMSADSLSNFQKADEIADYLQFATKIIAENIGPADAPAAIRLALLDAGSYDIATKSGGFSGAVVLNPSSLEAGVKPLVEKLTKAKKAIDEVASRKGSAPISWADLIYLAGRSATRQQWRQTKEAMLVSKGVVNDEGKARYDPIFENPFDAAIGRKESSTLGPNKLPALTASVEEITQFMAALGAKPGSGGFLSAKPPFLEQATFLLWTASSPNPEAEEERFAAASPKYAEIKKKYDAMRKKQVLARADYEIDFATAYNKLTILGASINQEQYLYPIEVMDISSAL